MPVMRTAVVIPTLGASSISSGLAALDRQSLAPSRVLVVHSGPRPLAVRSSDAQIVRSSKRLGFAAAANRGLAETVQEHDAVALLNDDAVPNASWLERLVQTLLAHPDAGAVQGTVTDREGSRVDGRGIAFDRWAVPFQVDRGATAGNEEGRQPIERWAVSATAALYRSSALESVRLTNGPVFDESFDSYHEDTDLGLRMARLGLRRLWTPDARCRHLGSHTGAGFGWRHPWWIAANRWRTLAGNLTPVALLGAMPQLLRGEIRVFRTLLRSNPRVSVIEPAVLSAIPAIVARGWRRTAPGHRLSRLPGETR